MFRFSPFSSAFASAVIVFVCFFSLVYFSGTSFGLDILLSSLVLILVFLVVYFINLFLINNRLKNLYLLIHNYRKNDSKNKDAEQLELNRDVFDEINKEVQQWAEERKLEIDKMKNLEAYRKEYLGNVSHELKTPIFNIQGYITTLLDGGLEDKTINLDYLQRAENSVERMIGIVDDLEAITQLEAGQMELDFEKFDIVQLAKEIFKAEEMKAATKGIIFRLMDNEEKPVYAFADRFRIRQVLTNLLVNSIKYGKEYGETKIKFYDLSETIRVEVSDNGIGISEKHLPRLFERFYRVDKHRSREQGGTGLGLAIVKHILEAHNQTISVMSTEGAGSVFSFTLKKG